MTTMELALVTTSALCALSAATFCVLYGSAHKRKKKAWWETAVGRNVMAMAMCVFTLSAGTIIRIVSVDYSHIGSWLVIVAYALTAIVMVWRTSTMWRANAKRRNHSHTT